MSYTSEVESMLSLPLIMVGTAGAVDALAFKAGSSGFTSLQGGLGAGLAAAGSTMVGLPPAAGAAALMYYQGAPTDKIVAISAAVQFIAPMIWAYFVAKNMPKN